MVVTHTHTHIISTTHPHIYDGWRAYLEPDVLDGEGDGGDGRLGGHHHLQIGRVEAQAEVEHDLVLEGGGGFGVWSRGHS